MKIKSIFFGVVMLVKLVIGVCISLSSATAMAQIVLGETQVQLVPGRTPSGGKKFVSDDSHIRISGDISRSAIVKLIAVLPEAKKKAQRFQFSGEPVVTVFLDSPGGDVQAAMQLGRILRSENADVWIDKNGECSSACILTFAGGALRGAVPGAKLGIHRPYFHPDEFGNLSSSDARREYNAMADSVRSYLLQMGVSNTLYEAMLQVPSQRMRYISHEFAESTQLIGDDPAYQELQRAKNRKALGQARQQMLDRYVECINSGKKDDQCARHIADWDKSK